MLSWLCIDSQDHHILFSVFAANATYYYLLWVMLPISLRRTHPSWHVNFVRLVPSSKNRHVAFPAAVPLLSSSTVCIHASSNEFYIAGYIYRAGAMLLYIIVTTREKRFSAASSFFLGCLLLWHKNRSVTTHKNRHCHPQQEQWWCSVLLHFIYRGILYNILYIFQWNKSPRAGELSRTILLYAFSKLADRTREKP